MAKKRKHDSKTTDAAEPPKKQQQQQQQQPHTQQQKQEQQQQQQELLEQQEQQQKKNKIQENVEGAEEEEEEDEEEEEYEEVEEEEEQEEVEEEEEEEDEEDGEEDDENPTADNQILEAAASAQEDEAGYDDDDDDDEPIENLLEPFGKDQLVSLLWEAADKHRDVADRIRSVADEDPVHRKIFVHGLGWDTNAETLINAFKQYGEIEDCKAVCDKASGKSKGYGFILFKKRSGARKALKEPQKKIGTRMTACQLASVGPAPASGAAAAPVQPVSEYTQRKIYVSNVGADLSPQKLVMFFSKYGEIEEGPLGLDKTTGKPKGFCLFVYRSVEGAKKALEEPHKNFEGHILHCQKAIDGPKPGKSQQHQHQHQQNPQNARFRRTDNSSYGGGSTSGPAHMMAPAAGFNQGAAAAAAAAAPALNPALGQALTALLATQGAGLGLTNLLGGLGSTATMNQGGVPGATPGLQGVYGNQANISPGVMGAYGNQGGLQGGYTNQQMGQGGSGRGQHGAGQYGGVAPYMGH